jgi:hypothetical protein
MSTKSVQFRLKRKTTAEWATMPILAEGEPGFETTTGQLKIGNGTSTWAQLPYVSNIRTDTAANLNTSVLGRGELAYSTDSKVLKIGDGSSTFASLTASIDAQSIAMSLSQAQAASATASTAATNAQNSATAAFNAQAATFTTSNTYETDALGRAGVTDGKLYVVVPTAGNGLSRFTIFKRVNAGTSDTIGSIATGTEVTSLSVKNLAYDSQNRLANSLGVYDNIMYENLIPVTDTVSVAPRYPYPALQLTNVSIGSSITGGKRFKLSDMSILPGDTFTIAVDLYSSIALSGAATPQVVFRLQDTPGNSITSIISTSQTANTNKIHSATFILPSNTTAQYVFVQLNGITSSVVSPPVILCRSWGIWRGTVVRTFDEDVQTDAVASKLASINNIGKISDRALPSIAFTETDGKYVSFYPSNNYYFEGTQSGLGARVFFPTAISADRILFTMKRYTTELTKWNQLAPSITITVQTGTGATRTNIFKKKYNWLEWKDSLTSRLLSLDFGKTIVFAANTQHSFILSTDTISIGFPGFTSAAVGTSGVNGTGVDDYSLSKRKIVESIVTMGASTVYQLDNVIDLAVNRRVLLTPLNNVTLAGITVAHYYGTITNVDTELKQVTVTGATLSPTSGQSYVANSASLFPIFTDGAFLALNTVSSSGGVSVGDGSQTKFTFSGTTSPFIVGQNIKVSGASGSFNIEGKINTITVNASTTDITVTNLIGVTTTGSTGICTINFISEAGPTLNQYGHNLSFSLQLSTSKLSTDAGGIPYVSEVVSKSTTDLTPNAGSLGGLNYTNNADGFFDASNYFVWGKSIKPNAGTFHVVEVYPANKIQKRAAIIIKNLENSILLSYSYDISADIWNAAFLSKSPIRALLKTPIVADGSTFYLVVYHAYGEKLNYYMSAGADINQVDLKRYYTFSTSVPQTIDAHLTTINETSDGNIYFHLYSDPDAYISNSPIVDESILTFDKAISRVLGNSDILLPSNIYTLQNTGAEYTVYTNSIIPGNWPKIADVDYSVSGATGYGQHNSDSWRLVPTTVPDNTNFTLNIELKDSAWSTISTKAVTVRPVKPAGGDTAVRYLSLGDSITGRAEYQRQVFNFTDATRADVTSLGIGGTVEMVGPKSRTLGVVGPTGTIDTIYKFEARSGYSMYGFYSSSNGGRLDGEDSLFVFPNDITAAIYRGNVNFWKKAITDAGFGYQILAREGSDDFAYSSSTGYPTHVVDPVTKVRTPIGPSETGWIVIDPALADETRWRRWNGTAWVQDGTQIRTWSFDFAKHLTRYALSSYSTGNPTHVSIYFAYNEGIVNVNNSPTTSWSTFFNDYEAMVTNIRAADSNIKVLILTPHLTEVQSGWKAVNSYRSGPYIRGTIQNFTKALLDKFDTAAKRTDKTYVVPFGSGIDPQYGYGLTSAARPNKYISDATLSIRSIVDPVHPDPFGSAQGGDWVAATIQGTRNT